MLLVSNGSDIRWIVQYRIFLLIRTVTVTTDTTPTPTSCLGHGHGHGLNEAAIPSEARGSRFEVRPPMAIQPQDPSSGFRGFGPQAHKVDDSVAECEISSFLFI